MILYLFIVRIFHNLKCIILQEENNNNVVSTGNKNHAAVALLQELQRTNASKKFNITTANPLLAGTYSNMRICTEKLLFIRS